MCPKKANNPQCNLLSKGEKIKQSEISKNLGYMLTSDGKCFKNEVQRRFAIAKDTFNKMSPILKNRNIGIGLGTKLSALKTYV